MKIFGRTWINLCRTDLQQKKSRINITHVYSHVGSQSPEQQGNNIADKVANEFRTQGDLLPPVPYFTASKERCGLNHGSSLVQGDPSLSETLGKRANVSVLDKTCRSNLSGFH